MQPLQRHAPFTGLAHPQGIEQRQHFVQFGILHGRKGHRWVQGLYPHTAYRTVGVRPHKISAARRKHTGKRGGAVAGGHTDYQRQLHRREGIFGAVQGELSQIVRMRAHRVVGYRFAVRQGRAAHPFASDPVDAHGFLHAKRRNTARLCRLRRRLPVRQQQPRLQPSFDAGMRLRHTYTQLLRQPRIRPALLTPSHELEGYQEVLGFELHLHSIFVNREY